MQYNGVDWTEITGAQGRPGYVPVKGIDYFDGEDGKTPTKAELLALIKPLIPEPIPGKIGPPGEPIDKQEIIDLLIEKIKKEQPIDISHIRNASSFMKDGIKYKIEELMHGGSTPSTATVVATEDISAQFDGLATTFTLPAYSSILSVTFTGWPPNGNLRPTVDFTTPTSTTIALVLAQVTAPVSGTTGIILYVAA